MGCWGKVTKKGLATFRLTSSPAPWSYREFQVQREGSDEAAPSRHRDGRSEVSIHLPSPDCTRSSFFHRPDQPTEGTGMGLPAAWPGHLEDTKSEPSWPLLATAGEEPLEIPVSHILPAINSASP